jgi:hypothetical protein
MVTTAIDQSKRPIYLYTCSIGTVNEIDEHGLWGRLADGDLTQMTSEHTLILKFLDIANDDELPWVGGRLYATRSELNRWTLFFESLAGPRDVPSISDLLPPFKGLLPNGQFQWAIRAVTHARHSHLDKLRQHFEAFLLPSLRTATGSLRMEPSVDGAYQLSFFFVSLSALQHVALYALLLLDELRPYGHALSLCMYSRCNGYFLSEQTQTGGRPRRRYCCSEHMTQSHRRDGYLRMRSLRERRKAGERKV